MHPLMYSTSTLNIYANVKLTVTPEEASIIMLLLERKKLKQKIKTKIKTKGRDVGRVGAKEFPFFYFKCCGRSSTSALHARFR